jgi:hypothetical protein
VRRVVDHQLDALGEYLLVVHDRIVGPTHQLVQPQPWYEDLSRIDHGHRHVVVLPHPICRHHSGVSAADHDYLDALAHGASFDPSGSTTRHRIDEFPDIS